MPSNKQFTCDVCNEDIDLSRPIAQSGLCIGCRFLYDEDSLSKIKQKAPPKKKEKKKDGNFAYELQKDITLYNLDINDLEVKLMRIGEDIGLIDMRKHNGNHKRPKIIKILLERLVRAYENKNGIIYVPKELRSGKKRTI